MPFELSKTQIDLLGERLKSGSRSEEDLRVLDAYRRTFVFPYEKVTREIRDKLKLKPTGRPAKSTASIIDKLRRESTRLSQIQDIAGCRIVTDDIISQMFAYVELKKIFPGSKSVNRINEPRYGYRAIHFIVQIDGKPIEIQLRSLLQHSWAELSEKYSDKFGHELKYGGGEVSHREFLGRLSDLVAQYENTQTASLKKILEHTGSDDEVLDEEYKRLDQLKKLSEKIIRIISDAGDELSSPGRG